MGQCVSSSGPKVPLKNNSFAQTECILLRLMYDDLANRSRDGKVTRQNFDTFFHVNGLWGQQMFRRFDHGHQGLITFEQFQKGIELMVKSPFEKRVGVLFEFYDVQHTGGITYTELIKMLYSYPKEELKAMITGDKFISTIDQYTQSYYFGPQRDSVDRYIVEEVPNESNSEQEPGRNASYYVPSSTDYINIHQKLKQVFQEERQKKHNLKPLPSIIGRHQPRLPEAGKLRKKRSGGSMTFKFDKKPKHFQLTSNIASLVKKYAIYLFKEMNVDVKKGSLSLQQFTSLVKDHYQIFSSYFEGFHSYVWQVNEDGECFFSSITPWIESQCECEYKGERTKRYLVFIRTTIFVFTRKKDKIPIEIKNMEGLNVEACKDSEDSKNMGIKIKHRDGIYQQKVYYFPVDVQKEWMRLLAEFQSNTIYNEYQLLERIGAGNFSVVYKGANKDTKKEVAIKVIEKFKLSLNQKEVLKMECGILELCHHPSIVRFIKKYDSKSHIYIITQIFSEGDLFEYVKKNSFLEEYEAGIIMKQLVDAIYYLNELGLIHRDLKPENIMIISNKEKNIIHRVKIIDFGFAVYKDTLKNLGAKQKFAGTPGFVAPEVLKMQDYDEGVDTFSLGIIMYFMLSGYLPFYSPIYEQIMEQTLECNISFNNAHWANVSEPAKDLLARILVPMEERIKLKEVMEHPWLKHLQNLKAHNGRNKKNRYV